jgi:excinuclease UvrABC ATPase subunit
MMLEDEPITDREISFRQVGNRGAGQTKTHRSKEKSESSGRCHNNLKKIDVSFPLGYVICVTGVSGSGKSTLVLETLYRAAIRSLQQLNLTAGGYAQITGLETDQQGY